MIEDSETTRRIIGDYLSGADYKAITAVDGFQGVKYAHEHKPDLIILDLTLPAGKGHAVLNNIKMSSHLNHIPIVVFTGNNRQ